MVKQVLHQMLSVTLPSRLGISYQVIEVQESTMYWILL